MKELVFPHNVCVNQTDLIYSASEQAFTNLNELGPAYSAALVSGRCIINDCPVACEVKIRRLGSRTIYSKITTKGECVDKDQG